MNVLLLAGGLGTRLRPLTEQLPKPMALVANRPWLEHLIVHLKEQGIRDIVIALKHYPEVIQNHFGSGEKWGVTIRYTVETSLLGTAGAIKNAEPFLDERFLVINADIVHQPDIESLVTFHARHGGVVTIGLTEVDDPSHYGVVEQDREGRILRFVEKPPREQAPSRLINAGIYVMEKRLLREIPAGQEVSIERETFPLLIEQDAGVYGKVISGYWIDMGTKERYRRLHWDLLKQVFPLPLQGRQKEAGIWIGENCTIEAGVRFVPPVLIGDNVKIGERSVIGPYCVIGSDCVIGKRVHCTETIMWDRCMTDHDVVVNNCIFGYDLTILPHHFLHEAVMSRGEVLHA